MKKKYITPHVETTMCLVEDFIAATGQGASQTTPAGQGSIDSGSDASSQKSKQYSAWESWDE